MEKLSVKNRYSRLNVAMKISAHVAIPAWRVLLTSSGWRVTIAAMPPTKAYNAHINARRSAKDPNTSTALAPLPQFARGCYMLLCCVELCVVPVPPGAASYLEAHFAWTCSATNLPSELRCPSTRACDLSTNVSGSG